MSPLPDLAILAEYLAGEFDNQEQAIADPAWYVHLRMWQRPVSLFQEDSLTLFAEQANILQIEQPYRQRIIRLTPEATNNSFKVQYYMLKDPSYVRGGGRDRALLDTLTSEKIEILPGCVLKVKVQTLAHNKYKFITQPIPDKRCTFDYAGKTVEVSLGFEATQNEFLSYDKGIDSVSRKATWGAILGPYRYTKLLQY